MMKSRILSFTIISTAMLPALAAAQGRGGAPAVPTPTDVKPVSITCEECPYPRLAMVQVLISNVNYADPVVYDWAHIQAPTLVFGGAEDRLAGPSSVFQERMKYVSETIPNGRARLQLLPGLGHVAHIEDPGRTIPPLVAFLKEGALRTPTVNLR
jgi:pimeloyl-ACP methyl ester carboxylesterase